MDEFHLGPWMTAVGDGELVTEVRLPLRAGAGSAHEKVERRAGDWAIAAASAARVDRRRHDRRGGHRASARSARPRSTLTRAEELLRGQDAVGRAVRRRPATIAAEDCTPIPDGRGPVDYKRHLAGVLTKRALRRATARALQQEA